MQCVAAKTGAEWAATCCGGHVSRAERKVTRCHACGHVSLAGRGQCFASVSSVGSLSSESTDCTLLTQGLCTPASVALYRPTILMDWRWKDAVYSRGRVM